MADEGDPAFIVNLMNSSTECNVFFLVGNESYGKVERIGVVKPMLMAHSLVLRRLLTVQDSDLAMHWDIPLPNITPRTFRNMLKYTYGFNNLQTHELPEAVRLLGVADKLVMSQMMFEVSKHIVNILTPNNVCLALTDPVCLAHKTIKEKIAQIIKSNLSLVLGSKHLHEVSPIGMKYLVQLNHLSVPLAAVWRAVVKWARSKVLKEEYSDCLSRLESSICPKLLLPSLKHLQLSALNLITLVEQCLSGDSPCESSLTFLRYYYLLSTEPPWGLYVCTETIKNSSKQTHEWFKLKVVHNSNCWTDAIIRTRSELFINTCDSSIQLYSVVCTALKKNTEKPSSATLGEEVNELDTYECQCSVKTLMYSDKEETSILLKNPVKEPEEKIGFLETLVNETTFKDWVIFDEEFEICLNSNCEMLILQPKNTYKIVIDFSSPHPLWFNNDIDSFNPSRTNDIDVGSGLVNKNNLWYGTHVTYVLYRPT